MPSASCPYSASVAVKLSDPAAHLDAALAGHLPSCEACRHAASAAVRNWPTDRSPSPSLAEWLSESVGKATVVSPFQAEQLAHGRAVALELGPYLLLDRLGVGGMGEVYRGWHKLLRREDAIKTVRPEIAGNAGAIKRFLREAEAVAKLRHPNVVHVYTADRAGAGYYLAMEFVPGTDLGKFARAKGPLPVRLACEFVRQAAEGLHHAFTHGLVHRDIKPGNLLLLWKDEGGRMKDEKKAEDNIAFSSSFTLHPSSFQVKVADFGLARALAPAEDASEMTAAGAVLGTTDYMAPEQAENAHTADTRADVYALGCTLHFLLTGSVPFPGGTAIEKMIRHATAPVPSPAALRPDVPPALDAVVRKCLAKRPDDRYQTPGELAAALLPFTRAAVPPPVPVAVAPAALDLPEPEAEEERTASWAPASRARAPKAKTDGERGRKVSAAFRAAPRGRNRVRAWLAGALLVAVAVGAVVYLVSGPKRDAGTKGDGPKTNSPTDPKQNPPDPNPNPAVGAPGITPPKVEGAPPWAFVDTCQSERKDVVSVVGFRADGAIVAGRDGKKGDSADTGYWEVWPASGGGKPLATKRPEGTKDWEGPIGAPPGALVTNFFRRYDPTTFKPLPDLSTDLSTLGADTPPDSIDALTATGDGRFLAGTVTANEKKKRFVAVWEADTGKVRGGGEVKTAHDVKMVAADHIGDTVAVGTLEGKVFTYTTKGSDDAWTAPKEKRGDDACTAVAITSDGKSVYSGYESDAVHRWKPGQGQPELTLHTTWPVGGLALSPDGRWLAACGESAIVWDLTANPPKPHALANGAGILKALAFSSDSKRLAVGGFGHTGKLENGAGTVWVWELK